MIVRLIVLALISFSLVVIGIGLYAWVRKQTNRRAVDLETAAFIARTMFLVSGVCFGWLILKVL